MPVGYPQRQCVAYRMPKVALPDKYRRPMMAMPCSVGGLWQQCLVCRKPVAVRLGLQEACGRNAWTTRIRSLWLQCLAFRRSVGVMLGL